MKTSKQLLKNHICRFNDGEQICGCYVSGQQEIISEIKNLITEQINIAHSENEKTSRLTALWNKI